MTIPEKIFTFKDAAKFPYFKGNNDAFRRFLSTFVSVPGFPEPPPGSEKSIRTLLIRMVHNVGEGCKRTTKQVEVPMGAFIKAKNQQSFGEEIGEAISSCIEEGAALHCLRRCWGCRKVWAAGEAASYRHIICITYPADVHGSSNDKEDAFEDDCVAVVDVDYFGYCADSPTCEKEANQAFMQYKKDQGYEHFDPETNARDPTWIHPCHHDDCAIMEDAPLSFLQCGRCMSALYCSEKCQAADWEKHKSVCKKPERKKGETKKKATQGNKEKKTLKKSCKKS